MKPVCCALLSLLAIAPSVARAGEDAAAAPFRELVTKLAAEDRRYVEQWWEANLDADAELERVAVLCDSSGDERHGYFLVEKDATHLWEITFDVDSRTSLCKGKPAAPPKWERRPATAIALREDRRDGYTITSYAIRIGQPVIVRDEEVSSAGAKPVVTDWDQQIKKHKAKNYQLPDHTRQIEH